MSSKLAKLNQKQSLKTLNINLSDNNVKSDDSSPKKRNKAKKKKNKLDNHLIISEVKTKTTKDCDQSIQVEGGDKGLPIEKDAEEDIGEEFLFNDTREKRNSSLNFKFRSFIRDKNNKPLYGVQFNHNLPKDNNFFATVGGNKVSVYECLQNGSNRLVQCYSDPDPKEDFWTVVWCFDSLSGNPLIITGGVRAIIRIIDCAQQKCIKHLIGHGSAINDLKINPYNLNLLLSSSKDYSLRLWNIKTCICIAKFGGDSGHRDQVISADFHLLSNKFIISGGMDHSIKIWSIDKKNIVNAIRASDDWDENKYFETQCEHFPVFTTRDVHNNYVDCVQWFGNFVLSKSCDNEIICWKPKPLDNKNGFVINKTNESSKEISLIDKFSFSACNIWFMKFSMNEEQSLLSVGNSVGVTYVWDTDCDDPFDVKPAELSHPKCKSAIRQTSFSSDGSILICVCEDSSVWRWDLVQN